jgi:8-oxo-dGTP diphosphatase
MVLGGCPQDDAADARWFPVADLPPLAFDHRLVVRTCLRHLAARPEAKEAGGRCGGRAGVGHFV